MYIDSIEIKYFRSIYSMKIRNVNSFNVFSGINDAGKSNIVKALNLFFNNQTDWNVNFDFSKDFSRKRLEEVRKETVKGKQFIQIKIIFNRGKRFENTLPNKFFVQKTWYRETTTEPETKDNLEQKIKQITNKKITIVKRSRKQFLNKIEFTYIPAIKHIGILELLLSNLQELILKQLKDNKLIEEVKSINTLFIQKLNDLTLDFNKATSLASKIILPEESEELFKNLKLKVNTSSPKVLNDIGINLDLRGDGIRMRFIPTLLSYIAKKSHKMHLWGFEEPENSLEYGMADRLFNNFLNEYSKCSQLFVTSHSPAFIEHSHDRLSLYRVYKPTDETKIKLIDPQLSLDISDVQKDIAEELGYTKLMQEMHKKYTEGLRQLKQEKENICNIKNELEKIRQPVLLTEGKTDCVILNTAWKKIYNSKQKQFVIKPCDSDGGGGGGTMLKKYVESIQHDNPNIIIGLFDRDPEGIKQYNKLKDSRKFTDCEDYLKSSTNKAYAMLLPIPEGKEDIAKYENLCIEFYFSDESLITQIEGKGLSLKEMKPTINGVPIAPPYDDEKLPIPKLYKITNGKNWFAEKIVPVLHGSEFTTFEILFKMIEKILQTSIINKKCERGDLNPHRLPH